VSEDPRIDAVEAMLPHSNCGACGYAGCRAFAEALVKEGEMPARCTVAVATEKADIAAFLGVEVGFQQQRVARLACAGGSNVSRWRAAYVGTQSCAAAAQVAGGGKQCSWGCLGFGDCAAVCEFDAIRMDEHNLPVVDTANCTACGDCVEVCPKDLFSLQSVDHKLWVKCKNQEQGDEILDGCEVACTGCGRCALDAPDQLIRMVNELPFIDTARLELYPEQDVRQSVERCPTGAIVWLADDGREYKGTMSHKITRQTELPPRSD
jgi:Na+-translocating ferredoxin:NAD+ oxidoreductase RNF subunit RnfB